MYWRVARLTEWKGECNNSPQVGKIQGSLGILVLVIRTYYSLFGITQLELLFIFGYLYSEVRV